ncbi:Zinc finger, B-box [Corchorus olitorius]|uniref:Zinc finger, B-box n=1 Tax=Corchorus olitorius TaxID=93759 RepID=A0A1R3JTJ7_9ROSI|nr:Zinc finger, B-box [Corchorus olitorius]
MKIWCDVCDKEEAIFFCSTNKAALCENCDRRVHHANELASKHSRFSLLHPTFKESPLCDICQERRAFLFCQEYRAILCRECDLPIHRANEHTRNITDEFKRLEKAIVHILKEENILCQDQRCRFHQRCLCKWNRFPATKIMADAIYDVDSFGMIPAAGIMEGPTGKDMNQAQEWL